MKYLFSVILFITINLSISGQVFPVEEVGINGENAQRIIFVFMGDGYQADEMTKFSNDVQNISGDLYQTTPFKEYAAFFNTYRIEVPSNESGADHPGTATDVTEPAHEVKDVDNYFRSTFDFAGIHRLLVPSNGPAFSVLATNVPDYDQGFVLANSPHYGGSGGTLATSSTNTSASEISIHEIGHSFANLKDEYWAGDQFASEGHNMTAESDPAAVKWNLWVGLNNIGVFPYGNTGNPANWYRPHQNCKMRFLGVPFCSVCTQRIIDRIYQLVDPIDSYGPTEASHIFIDQNIAFTADLVYPNPNTLDVNWVLNGNTVASDVEDFELTKEMLDLDENDLSLIIYDKTTLSKSFEDGYRFQINWKIWKDFDNDGFTSDMDCDDEDADINPDADDIPDNGIDEDCDGVDGMTSGTNDVGITPVKLSPNPFVDFVQIQCECSGEFGFVLLDQSGKKLKEGKVALGMQQTKLDFSNLPKGVYILKLSAADQSSAFEQIIIKS